MKTLLPLFGLILLIGCKNALPKTEKSNPPNIIYIMADDLGYGDIGEFMVKPFLLPPTWIDWPKEACAFYNTIPAQPFALLQDRH
jgi:hypothetical protein